MRAPSDISSHDTAEDRTERFAGYAQAQMKITNVDGTTLLLRPRTEPGTSGSYPFGAEAVHVITAFDPGPVTLSPEQNAGRQDELLTALDEMSVAMWEALSGAADGTHEESSVVVEGLSDDDARTLGAACGQEAIFRWSRETWSVLPCDDAPAVHLGWEVEEVGDDTVSR